MATAFENVSVIAMDRDECVDAQTVVVDRDRIAWLGPVSEAVIPEGARRIDARGRFLLPGLADMHTHPMTEADLLLFVASGVTTVRNMWGTPRHLMWSERAGSGDLLGPAIYTTGPIVDGQPVTGPWLVSVTTPNEARRAVDTTTRAGYGALKVYNHLTREAYGWLVEAARDHEVPVVGHVPFDVGLRRVLESRQSSIEHLYGYVEAMQPKTTQRTSRPRVRADVLMAAQTATESGLADLARMTRQAGTWNCPTLIVRRRFLQDPAALQRRTETRYRTPLRAAQWAQHLRNYPDAAMARRFCDLHLRTVKALADEGAGLLAGTDAPVPMVTPGTSLHEELEALTMAGLTPFQALRAATADAARFLGAPGEWGTITPGARADLLLVDANPLVDVRNASRIAGVMVRGRWLSGDDLRDRLDELAARQAAAGNVPLDKAVPAARGRGWTERARYLVTWDGRAVGEVELTVAPAGCGWELRERATIEQFGHHLLAGYEAGTYHSVVRVDSAGLDQTATFRIDGRDGRQRIDLVRENGAVRVRPTGPVRNPDVEPIHAEADALLSWPLTMLYARLGKRLRGLATAHRVEVPIVGPGLPPNVTVEAATLRVERLTDLSDPGIARRYTLELIRSNATYAGVLCCDDRGLPVELELNGPATGTFSSPPVRVRRT